jgi:hypothetical protein
MYSQLDKCPVCGNEMMVTRLYCSQCDTTIEGHFQSSFSQLAKLTPEQVQFLLTFVRCEGRFTRLEEELKLSYPTLRNRLNEIVRALGFEPRREETPAKLSPEERSRILEDLEQGSINIVEAQRLLRGKKDEEPG